MPIEAMESERDVQASCSSFLRKNPELAKVMLASGLQRSAVTLAGTLGIQNLRAMVWGESTAQNTAIVSMCLNLLAMTTGGLFGRLGDSVGRRVAACTFGFTSFLPAFALLTFGFNSTGLLVSSIGSVLSGFGCSSDALLVLAHDVTLEEDRALAFGLFQAATNLIAFVLYGLPALLTVMLQVLPNPSIMAWLYYQFGLSAAYFLVVVAIKMPAMAEHDGHRCDRELQPDLSTQPDLEANPDQEVQPPPAVQQTSNVEEGKAQANQEMPVSRARRLMRMLAGLPVISELLMVLHEPALGCVLLIGALLAFSGDLVFDIGSQFFRDELDLLGDDSMSEQRLKQNQLISVLTTLPAEIFIIPGAMLVGSLGHHFGSLQLLKILIPLAGAFTASGAIMALAPSYWLVPVVCIAQNYAALPGNIPLKHLVAQVAPEGRVGQAMGTLGMLGQAVSFVANATTAAVTPVLLHYMQKPLWIYYLVCGTLTLAALLPAYRIVLPPAEDKLESSLETTDDADSISRPGTPKAPHTPLSITSREQAGINQ